MTQQYYSWIYIYIYILERNKSTNSKRYTYSAHSSIIANIWKPPKGLSTDG